MSMQHLDGRLQLEPHMLTKVHFRIAALSQQADQPIVAKLLSNAVCHRLWLLGGAWRTCKAWRLSIVGGEATPVKRARCGIAGASSFEAGEQKLDADKRRSGVGGQNGGRTHRP